MNEMFRKVGLVNLEELSDEELEKLHKEFEGLHHENPTLEH